MKAGQVYRRADILKMGQLTDHQFKKLISDGHLKKISRGIYYAARNSAFGMVPPNDEIFLRAFLKENRFLLISFNDYNALGIGTTQLYNEQRVYNHRRHGEVKLGKRTFHFIKKRSFPKTISPEFLLVDLIDNIDKLAEDRAKVLNNVKRRALSMDQKKLRRAVRNYGGTKARKFFADL